MIVIKSKDLDGSDPETKARIFKKKLDLRNKGKVQEDQKRKVQKYRNR